MKLFIILALSLFFTWPFFHKGYFATDDGQWAIVRLAEMIRELKDFQIPPRWSDYLNHGYGYPLFSFTYPFPYYLGSIIHLGGLGLTDTIKFLFVGSVFLSGVFMYLLGKELINEKAGILVSVFYIGSPYRLNNLYVRGSLGESLNFAVFPLLCYGSLLYLKRKDRWSFLLASFSLAILILTHNASAMLFFPFWILFLITINFHYKENFKNLLATYLPVILLGIGISAYFLFPAVLEKKYVSLSQNSLADFNKYFAPVSSLGLLNLTGFLAGLSFSGRYFTLFFLISVASGLFLVNPLSLIFWTFPPLNLLDFPFRLLGPLTFIISLGAGFAIKNKNMLRIGYLIVFATIFYNLQQVSVKEYFVVPDSYYSTNDATTTSNDELMPVWVKEKPRDRYQNKIEVVHGNAEIKSLKYSSKDITFTVNAKDETAISVNTIYFPGWEFAKNGEKIAFELNDKKGTIIFNVSPGEFKIKGTFSQTQIRRLANWMTLLSILICFMIVLRPRKYAIRK